MLRFARPLWSSKPRRRPASSRPRARARTRASPSSRTWKLSGPALSVRFRSNTRVRPLFRNVHICLALLDRRRQDARRHKANDRLSIAALRSGLLRQAERLLGSEHQNHAGRCGNHCGRPHHRAARHSKNCASAHHRGPIGFCTRAVPTDSNEFQPSRSIIPGQDGPAGPISCRGGFRSSVKLATVDKQDTVV
jgi:hypothetical protein